MFDRKRLNISVACLILLIPRVLFYATGSFSGSDHAVGEIATERPLETVNNNVDVETTFLRNLRFLQEVETTSPAITVTTTSTSTTKTLTDADHLVLEKKPAVERFRKDYKPPLFVITDVNLEFDLDYETTTVRSKLKIYRPPSTPACTDLILDGDELTLLKLSLNGHELPLDAATKKTTWYINSDGALVISGSLLPTEAKETFEVATVVNIHPSKNFALMGLFKSSPILVAYCEPEGFRRLTYFIDRPDVMSKYRVKLSGSKAEFPAMLSNGNRIEGGDVQGIPDRHYVIYEDPFPKSCYRFAVVAGQVENLHATYQHPEKPNGKSVDIFVWSEASNLPKLHWAMESIKRAMQWDEDVFGLEYDLNVFNIVCVKKFDRLVMESKSLRVFASSYLLASPETSTDNDYGKILRVVSHEYFHNWTGDRVNIRDWFQLTLKEGLTVFREQQFSGDMASAAVERITNFETLRLRQFAEDSGPLAHPVRPESVMAIDDFYTVTVAYKGAEVVRMYHTILGASGFRQGMDLYFQRHDGQAVTCDDFRAAMADANNVDFTQFERWYTQAGTPEVTVLSSHYDPSAKTFTFKVKQETPTRPGNLPFHIPLVAGLIGGKSQTEISPSKTFSFTKAEQEFVFENVSVEPRLSILRDFSAPVKLFFERTDEEHAFLMAYDTDSFNRWDSAQILMQRILLNRAVAIRNGEVDPNAPPPLRPVVIEAFRRILNQEGLDMSLKAYTFVLPLENVLANEMRPCDPIAIHQARNSVRKQIRDALVDEMETEYNRLTLILADESYAYLPASENVAPRQLRRILLEYLTIDDTAESVALAFNHFRNCSNMTDRKAALQALVNKTAPERQIALDEFYEGANGAEGVLNGWIMTQASADTETVLQDVNALMLHPEFSLKQPSRLVMVAIGFVFNSAHFHSEDGAGYIFLADVIIKVDDFNGATAAGLASFLIDWKRYDVFRQNLIKAQLQRIMDKGNLKKETYEIVSKALNA